VIEQMRDTARTGNFPDHVVEHYNGPVAGISNLKNEAITVTYANAGNDPLIATLTVTWTSYTGQEHTEAIGTYITQRGG
jgi:hypothetical protein